MTANPPDMNNMRLPPQNIEAEQSLLGGLMHDSDRFDDVVDLVSADDFYRLENRLIFEAIVKLIGTGGRADIVTVQDVLLECGHLDSVGGIGYLGNLVNNTPSAVNVSSYAKLVREKAILRRLIGVATDIQERAYQPNGAKPAELLDAIQAEILGIGAQSGKEPAHIGEAMLELVDAMDALQQQDGELVGVSTGFPRIDSMLSGLNRSDMIIIAARPSMGKTTLALNFAENVSRDGGNVMFFSLEMSKQQIAQKLTSSVGHVDFQALRTARLSNEEWARVLSAGKTINDFSMYIDDTPALSTMEIRSRARRIHRKRQLDLIVIDYMQLITAPKAENRNQELTKVSGALKALAKELDVPVVALSQLSRNADGRRPRMSDLRESGAIEQDADVVSFIYREKEPQTLIQGVAEFIVDKHRMGPTGHVYLSAELGQSRFLDYHGPDPVIETKRRGGFA